MKVLCLGGGPAGLYFAISLKLRDASHDVTVLERNRANDTFGWGVVLSDDALSRMQKNDTTSTNAIRGNFAYWDDIAVVHRGKRTVSGGHGFAGIGRKAMLIILQQRARLHLRRPSASWASRSMCPPGARCRTSPHNATRRHPTKSGC